MKIVSLELGVDFDLAVDWNFENKEFWTGSSFCSWPLGDDDKRCFIK